MPGNMRLLLSSLTMTFCFALYAENICRSGLLKPGGSIIGDMFFNGTVQTGSAASNGVTYVGAEQAE